MAVKKLFEKQFKGIQALKNEQTAALSFGTDVQNKDGKVTAAEAVQVIVNDITAADWLKPGKMYTITITE